MKNLPGSGNIVGWREGKPQACTEILYTEQHGHHQEGDDDEDDGEDDGDGEDDDHGEEDDDADL